MKNLLKISLLPFFLLQQHYTAQSPKKGSVKLLQEDLPIEAQNNLEVAVQSVDGMKEIQTWIIQQNENIKLFVDKAGKKMAILSLNKEEYLIPQERIYGAQECLKDTYALKFTDARGNYAIGINKKLKGGMTNGWIAALVVGSCCLGIWGACFINAACDSCQEIYRASQIIPQVAINTRTQIANG